MPANSYVFLLGLAVGIGLFGFGMLLGYWLGYKPASSVSGDSQQFLSFLQNLSRWTSDYARDVSRYQSKLAALDQEFRSGDAPSADVMLQTLQQIMLANRELQTRLENAEQKLEVQTGQISSYLTEARTDGLTALLNRKAFDQALNGLFGEWESTRQTFSVGMIDIDHFKQINDTYGHPAGDAVLRKVSALLRTELGDEVCVARYGGEEFAILSLRSGDQMAAELERVRKCVSQLHVSHDAMKLSISFSAGAAEIEANDTIGKLVRRADEALYAAKLGGRDLVYNHDGTICHLVTQRALPASDASQPDTLLSPPTDTSLIAEEIAQAQLAGAKIAQRLQRIVEEESQRLLRR